MVIDRELHLYFEDGEAPQLVRTVYHQSNNSPPIIGTRSSYLPSSSLSFRWSSTTHAVCVFLVLSRLKAHTNSLHEPILVGDRNTMAASLGGVLRKQRICPIFDLFGSDAGGRPNLNRMILCYNYNRKVPGPMQVYFRSAFLKPEQIRIFTQQKDISTSKDSLAYFASKLESTWTPHGNKKELDSPGLNIQASVA